MTQRRRTNQERNRAFDEAKKRGDERFGPKFAPVIEGVKALLAGRPFKALSSGEMVRFMVLRAEFDALTAAHKHFMDEVAAELLDPDERGPR